MIKFGNNGSIDSRVWSTFGVSIKGNGDSIGKFGTGLKYAIAVLLRNNRKIEIASDGVRYEFSTREEIIRDKQFNQITCNGDLLPFTTHLGSEWELWQAYRELYSNCLDEGGGLDFDGDTVIQAELDDINHYDIFLNKDKSSLLASTAGCDIYSGGSSYIYHKGIRAGDVGGDSLFTYNIKNADLTEDRTFKYPFEINQAISNAVLGSDNDDLIYPFIFNSKDKFEEGVGVSMASVQPSPRIMDLIAQYRRENVYMHNGVAGKALSILGSLAFDKVEMTVMQEKIINKAKLFCKSIGYEIIYPINVASNLGKETLAVADRKSNEIYLSERVLTQGVKQVASTLLEENIHLKYGLSDLTYDMQSFLFDQMITLGEQLTGDIL